MIRVLPLLAEMCNPQAAAHLVRAADLLREDARFLDRLAERRFRRVSRFEDGRIVLDAPRLAAQDPVLARRMTALALRRAGVDPRRITAKHVGAVLDLATGGRGRSVDLPGGRRAVRDEDAVRIE